jgi:hypothetical protein
VHTPPGYHNTVKQQPHARPSLLKLHDADVAEHSLLHDVRERGVLGAVLGDIHVVEFQK